MSAAGGAAGAAVGGGERLVLTLLFSALLHGVVLLGVGFGTGQPAPAAPMLDIILVSTGTSQAPDQADFLAQANQEGGGDMEEAERPLASAAAMERPGGSAAAGTSAPPPQTAPAPCDPPAKTVPTWRRPRPKPSCPLTGTAATAGRSPLAAEQASRQQGTPSGHGRSSSRRKPANTSTPPT